MFIQKKKKNQGISEFSEQIKEKSILYRFNEDKYSTDEKNFLYCDPPEVILQSKKFLKNLNIKFQTSKKTRCMKYLFESTM